MLMLMFPVNENGASDVSPTFLYYPSNNILKDTTSAANTLIIFL